MKIIQGNREHLNELATLFNNYRIFYRQESNLEGVKSFLSELFLKQDSIIFIAYINNVAVGFTQLYTLLSSVSMRPMFVLNDLYIDSNYRNKQIGTALINKAKTICNENGYKGLIIQTEQTNPAQHLYQGLGFVKDKDLSFFWTNVKL